jgi:transcriptional regulator with PAS, ATPase and Fis domain
VKTLETGRRTSLSLRTSAGKEFLAVAQPVFNRNSEIIRVVCNVRNVADIRDKNAKVKSTARGGSEQIIAESDAMQRVLELANRASSSDSNVLITGETGVGKGMLARLIYEKSARTNRGSFVKVMCPAIPPTLFESELLGYEKGAFTGALTTGKKGLIETADGGVLFLDEIGELPTELQAKLLSVIEEKSFLTVGGRIAKRVDVRTISATNRDIGQLMTSNLFREDLYYRLSVIPIFIPPLRERREDIIALVTYFSNALARSYGLQKSLSPALNDFFYHHSWPGNVRELVNLLEYLYVANDKETVDVDDLPPPLSNMGKKQYYASCVGGQAALAQEGKSLREMTEEYELSIIQKAIEMSDSYVDAAYRLHTSLSTINRKIRRAKQYR